LKDNACLIPVKNQASGAKSAHQTIRHPTAFLMRTVQSSTFAQAQMQQNVGRKRASRAKMDRANAFHLLIFTFARLPRQPNALVALASRRRLAKNACLKVKILARTAHAFTAVHAFAMMMKTMGLPAPTAQREWKLTTADRQI
jgi:hypothetical protein